MLRLFALIKPSPKSQNWEDFFHGRETLLWEGKPEPGIKNKPSMIFLSLFGLPFLAAGIGTLGGGISTLATGGAGGVGMGLMMIVFSLPFITVGFGLVFGTWIAGFYAHQFTRYALSNKRAYIATSWWSHTMQSYPITPDTQFELEEGRFDTVYFFTKTVRDSDGDRREKKVGFRQIKEGMAVYKLLRDVQAEAIERNIDRQ